MRAIDTNVLVYSEIISSPHHKIARAVLTEFAEGPVPWAIPWPCIYEFLRVVTHPRVFTPPVPLHIALQDLQQILRSPTLTLLAQTDRHLEVLSEVIESAAVTGNLIHDAHIAALCIEHGISELVTGDRDFSRFPITTFDPFRSPR